MENKNGQGIFYGVIGVATLVVAIVGATFAFFSAQANSNVDAVTASGANITLQYTQVITGLKTNLIPVDATNANFPRYPGITASDCQDVNGNNICSVYTFTVTNPTGNAAQRVYATMTPQTNTFTHLHYAVFKGTDADIDAKSAKYDVDGTAVTAVSNPTKHIIGTNGDLVIADTALTKDATSPITLAPLEQVLNGGESVSYTIVLWIQEQNAVQNEDQGKAFAAGITFTTGTGSGVTGVLSAG